MPWRNFTHVLYFSVRRREGGDIMMTQQHHNAVRMSVPGERAVASRPVGQSCSVYLPQVRGLGCTAPCAVWQKAVVQLCSAVVLRCLYVNPVLREQSREGGDGMRTNGTTYHGCVVLCCAVGGAWHPAGVRRLAAAQGMYARICPCTDFTAPCRHSDMAGEGKRASTPSLPSRAAVGPAR